MNLRLLIKVVFLGAAVASSFLDVAADVSIGSSFEIGPLWNVSERSALFELGNSLNQRSWTQLRDETWHESAFRSFFAVGSLDANQMNALAAQNNKSNTWKSSNVTINAASDLMARLQAVSTTRYHIHRSIPGTGNIEAFVWTLMFSCGSTSCIDGYMVPILLVPDTEQGSTMYSYVTAWLPVTDGVLMNTIPASISKNATQEEDTLNQPASIFHFNIQAYLPPCPKARVHSFRTLLDSAYGLAPAFTCIGFSDDDADSFKVTVTNGSSDGRTWKQVLESLELRLINVSDQWLQQPFEKCFQRPLLILPEGSDSLPHMCHHNKCMVFFPKDNYNSTSQIQTGLQFLKGLEKVLDEGPSQCTSNFRSNFITCDSLYNISSFYDLDSTDLEPFTSSLRSSDWASEEGKHTSEFYYAPHGKNLIACAIELTSPSNKLLKPPVEIHIQARDYLTAFITEHNTAFTTAKGPATDPYTFYALLITAALSVITITVPLTNFILAAICHVRPMYFNIQKGKGGGAYMASKMLIQVCCNVGLTLAFFLPVLSLARNEMDREIEFSTWALASDDLVADDISPAVNRVVYLFDVTSKYHSKFLRDIVLAMCITCLFVAVCTAWRCLKVFARYRLLLAAAADTTFTSSSAIMHALKAIEMGDAEFLELKLVSVDKTR